MFYPVKILSMSVMVIFAILLHLSWATFIWIDEAAVRSTALYAIHRWIQSPYLLSLTLVAIAAMAIGGLFSRKPWFLVLLMPQQIIMMISAAGAVEAIWLAQFADGNYAPRTLIAVNQFYGILGAIGHTTAIVFHALRSSS